MSDTAFTQRQQLVWGAERLAVLQASHVVVAGVGGLGCTVAEQLARAGIGELSLIDNGIVAVPDLGRQVLYTQHDIGKDKVTAAERHLKMISPFLQIHTFRVTIENDCLPLAHKDVQIYADCLDNYESRFALERNLPLKSILVHAGIEYERGQVTTIVTGTTPSLKTIFCDPGPREEQPVPVIPQACSIVGGYQSLVILNNLWEEAGLPGAGLLLRSEMLVVDLHTAENSTIHLA